MIKNRQELDEVIKTLLFSAFKKAIGNKKISCENNKKSAYFVSQLAVLFSKEFGYEALVQATAEDGTKSSGEWLFDITLVSKGKIETDYKKRSSEIIKKIHWVIESEFSTNIHEFCRDFAKLLHVKSEAYLYIAGLNQENRATREQYIDAQTSLAKKLVVEQKIDQPFYLAFIPTSGKCNGHNSAWDKGYDELQSWIKVVNLSNR